MWENIENNNLKCCPVCGEKTEIIVPLPKFDGSGTSELRKFRRNCKCKREAQEAYNKQEEFKEIQRRIDILKQISLLDAKFKDVSLSTYKITEENKEVFATIKDYIENFDEMFQKGQGLLFYGDVGTGKSYAAAVIANELLNKSNPVIMTSFVKLLRELQNFEKNQDLIERLDNAKLLIIDDFGAERSTEFALENIYNVIDSRDRSGKPIIITTNLTFEYMKDCNESKYKRIYDRIFGTCYPVKAVGFSWRKKEAVVRFESMKERLKNAK